MSGYGGHGGDNPRWAICLESGEAPAYAPGSAEERNLRNNTRYIAPEADVIGMGVLSLLIGALVTFLIVFAPLYAFAHAWGWLLRWQAALTPARQHVLVASVPVWTWALPAAAGIVTCGLFVRWWLTLAPRSPGRGSSEARSVWRAALIAAALAVATLAAPAADAWLSASGGVTGTICPLLRIRFPCLMVAGRGGRTHRGHRRRRAVLPGRARQVAAGWTR